MAELFAHPAWNSQAALLAGLHLVFATMVTVHVLLTKRDIGASIGWIGLGWLSPFAGGGLYYVFGINRVRRRANRLRGGQALGAAADEITAPDRTDHLAPLDRAARRLSQHAAVGGNRIEILHDGDGAYPPMLAAIEAAQSSIALCTYIIRNDIAGRPFLDALIRAHARGVQVRVLMDGIGSGYFVSVAFQHLSRAGVPVLRFMHSPKPWLMPFLNLRTHKKILVVDGRTCFTGGLNIGAENLGSAAPRRRVRDLHFVIEGPVVGQLVEAFARDWLFVSGETVSGQAWYPALQAAGDKTARTVVSGPDRDVEKIEFLALTACACAQSSIQVLTPYFLPDERLISALALASLRGVAVDIVIPEASNHRLVDFACRANIGPLLQAGARVWLNPPPFDHSKLMVVDGLWAMIGSANWDMRSLRLNFELNVEVYDEAMAAELQSLLLARRGRALTVSALASRRLPTRLRDAGLRLMLPYL